MQEGQDFLQLLLTLPSLEALYRQQCPECRGRLRISFVQPIGERGSLEARCYDCTYVDELEAVANPPRWSSGKERVTVCTKKQTEDA